MVKISSVYEVPAVELIEVLTQKLKEFPEFQQPEWAKWVKTGRAKERPPEQKDWWYRRAASILRTIYKHGIVGTERLRTKYGSREKHEMSPEKFRKASGKIIRTILQQADKAGLTEIVKKPHAGRRLTKKGKEWLEAIAAEIKAK